MINEEEDDERLLRMQNQAIDENDEAHEDIIEELENMDDEDGSAQTLKFNSVRGYKLQVRKLEYNGS